MLIEVECLQLISSFHFLNIQARPELGTTSKNTESVLYAQVMQKNPKLMKALDEISYGAKVVEHMLWMLLFCLSRNELKLAQYLCAEIACQLHERLKNNEPLLLHSMRISPVPDSSECHINEPHPLDAESKVAKQKSSMVSGSTQ